MKITTCFSLVLLITFTVASNVQSQSNVRVVNSIYIGALDHSPVTVYGVVTHYSSAPMGANMRAYILRDNWTDTVKVVTRDSYPEISKEFKVEGVVSVDEMTGERWIVEVSRELISESDERKYRASFDDIEKVHAEVLKQCNTAKKYQHLDDFEDVAISLRDVIRKWNDVLTLGNRLDPKPATGHIAQAKVKEAESYLQEIESQLNYWRLFEETEKLHSTVTDFQDWKEVTAKWNEVVRLGEEIKPSPENLHIAKAKLKEAQSHSEKDIEYQRSFADAEVLHAAARSRGDWEKVVAKWKEVMVLGNQLDSPPHNLSNASAKLGEAGKKIETNWLLILLIGALIIVLAVLIFVLIRERMKLSATDEESVITAFDKTQKIRVPLPTKEAIENETVKLMPGRFEVEGGQEIKEIPIFRPRGIQDHKLEYTFGRLKGSVMSHIQLEDQTVSKRQARMKYNKGKYTLINIPDPNDPDRNATIFNDVEMKVNEERELNEGDRIKMGNVSLIYRER
ncbi:hypothetical protein CEE37_14440 [candidate division LCP-89 bacterium B3_LCP]|uniref:FHA domain-containing protein n=1 Tax=candidate division LCP-89 bacterium B3_LCP TaxID=2012998 RepID=A0A532UPP5_UNCL8|nr:MAG: hypothetical protein CEE37_14440 [candidate division LCP-89 bacterium B3_LCP]